MARHVHIHMHDSKWEESKHPRKDDGKFGKGKGDASGKTPKTNTEMASLAHEAYLAAVHAGNGAMADHYQKQRERFKSLAKSEREHRGRETGPAEGSKGESDLVDKGGPLSEKDRADIAAHNQAQRGPQKKAGLTKSELKQQARAEYESANKGKGSYHKAALLYEQAGEADKARGAHAMAKRYKHDPEGQAEKSKADLSEARLAREEAEKSKVEHDVRLWNELAEAFEERSKDPESNELTARISELRERLSE